MPKCLVCPADRLAKHPGFLPTQITLLLKGPSESILTRVQLQQGRSYQWACLPNGAHLPRMLSTADVAQAGGQQGKTQAFPWLYRQGLQSLGRPSVRWQAGRT